jgi:type I restriction enzyme S subunit
VADTALSAKEILSDSEWTTRALKEVATILMGQSPPSSTYNTSGDGLPFLQGKAEFGEVNPKPEKWCSDPKRVAPGGSILVSVRAPVGDVNLANDEYCIGRGLAAIVCEETCDPEFIFFNLLHEKSRLQAQGTGTTFQSINKGTLTDFEVRIPPLGEQHGIAGVLRSIHQAKEATEQVIVALRELRRSLLDHLLRFGPVRLDARDDIDLQDTDVGSIPKHWRIRNLGDLSMVGNGSTPKKSNDAYWTDGTIPWITSAKVHDGVIDTATAFVTERAVRECHLPLVQAGSVVVAITGQGKTLGNAAIIAMDTRVSQHLAYIKLENGDLMAEFLLVFLQSRYSDLRAIANAGGSTKGALTCGFLRTYPLPCPPIAEQQAIVGIVSSVDSRISAEQERVQALTEVLQSTLHELMTGQRRVPVPEAVGG